MNLSRIEVSRLGRDDIQSMLREKYQIDEKISKQVATLLDGCSIKELLELGELVDNKKEYSEWEFYWMNLLTPKED